MFLNSNYKLFHKFVILSDLLISLGTMPFVMSIHILQMAKLHSFNANIPLYVSVYIHTCIYMKVKVKVIQLHPTLYDVMDYIYIHTHIYIHHITSPIHLLINTWVVFISWLLQIMLLWTYDHWDAVSFFISVFDFVYIPRIGIPGSYDKDAHTHDFLCNIVLEILAIAIREEK